MVAAVQKKEIDVAAVVEAINSGDCSSRWRAINVIVRDASRGSLPKLELEIRQASSQAAKYLQDIFDLIRKEHAAATEAEAISRASFSSAKDSVGDKKDEAAIARAEAALLMGEIEDLKRSLRTRAKIVGHVAARAAHYSHPRRREADYYLDALKRLLSGQNLMLRAAAAISLLRSGLGSKAELVPISIDALSSEDLSMRVIAQQTLLEATGQEICFNPLDPPSQREASISQWKAWWEKHERGA